MPDPARNNHSSRHPEQAICDVVVVGGGGAGLAAAIEVAERGGHAVLLEKNPSLGGSTAWSVGSISATRTSHQDDAGIVDHPDDHYEDMEVLAGSYANRDNRELRRILVDRTTEMMQWLEQSGLVFVGPNVEPPPPPLARRLLGVHALLRHRRIEFIGQPGNPRVGDAGKSQPLFQPPLAEIAPRADQVGIDREADHALLGCIRLDRRLLWCRSLWCHGHARNLRLLWADR
jgi:hypothetical protein